MLDDITDPDNSLWRAEDAGKNPKPPTSYIGHMYRTGRKPNENCTCKKLKHTAKHANSKFPFLLLTTKIAIMSKSAPVNQGNGGPK